MTPLTDFSCPSPYRGKANDNEGGFADENVKRKLKAKAKYRIHIFLLSNRPWDVARLITY